MTTRTRERRAKQAARRRVDSMESRVRALAESKGYTMERYGKDEEGATGYRLRGGEERVDFMPDHEGLRKILTYLTLGADDAFRAEVEAKTGFAWSKP